MTTKTKAPEPPLQSGPRQEQGMCPACGATALMDSDMMEWREALPGFRLVVTGLSGKECDSCWRTWFNASSYRRIQNERRDRPIANYEASVSRVGGNSLGIYLPKDLQRVMNLEAKQAIRLTPLDPSSVLMELIHPAGPDDLATRMEPVDDALGLLPPRPPEESRGAWREFKKSHPRLAGALGDLD